MDDAVSKSQAFWQAQSAQSVHPAKNSAGTSTEPTDNSAPGSSPSESRPSKFTLGMDSFDENERQQLGENIRLSIALIEGKTAAPSSAEKALPDDSHSIALRLKSLNQDITSNLADQLELLVRFDTLKGWQQRGAKNCASWMNIELGVSVQLAWEYLRVGRQLRSLPVLTALFRAGKLSWSKVRLISRVANDENESLLCHAALDASVSQVEQLCNTHRWRSDENDRNDENARAQQQWEARSLRWDNCSNGNVRICLSLPPEIAQAFLNSVEHSLAQQEPAATLSYTGMTQRRADAAVLMAENSLQNAGRDIATADRYQVIVSVDAKELGNEFGDKTTFTKRATILGTDSDTSPLAKDTARRLSCDCSVSAIFTNKGEPVDIGQKTRLWPAAMARTIKARDKQCVFPGCTQSRHLHIHHIVHWADGGSTSVDNAACLCSHHHTLVHEGGYRIEQVESNEQRRTEQFMQQTVNAGDHTGEVERRLRNSPESFDTVRRVSPERFRFRVVDSDGCDVVGKKHSTHVESTLPESAHTVNKNNTQATRYSHQSTTVALAHSMEALLAE